MASGARLGGLHDSVERKGRLLLLLCLGVGLLGQAIHAQEAPDPRKLLEELNDVAVDPAQVYVLRDAQITRGRVNIYLNRGFIGFLTSVAGETTGAVFQGDGEILLIPPDPVEKGSLARFTGSPILTEPFTSALLRFTDQTAQELKARARLPDPEDTEQPTGFVDYWNPVVRRLNPDYSMRILQDLLGNRDLPFFHAHVNGVNQGVFQVVVDERLPEAIHVAAARRSHGKLYADLWCSFPSPTSQARREALMVGAVKVLSYQIDTRIHEDHSLEGRAELELESRSNADRVVAFELSRMIKVSEVRDDAGRDLVVFQSPSLEESETAARGNDWIMVVLPTPVPKGRKFRLTFSYRGNVIAEVGNGVLYVGARGSWYPSRGAGMRATYDLTFHYPDRLTLVATGNCVEEKSSGGLKHSRWISETPFAVAGFNLGAYDFRARRAGQAIIEVYAAREAEEELEKRHVASQPNAELVRGPGREGQRTVIILRKPVPRLDPAAWLDSVAESAANAATYYEKLFGPLPYPRLAISQAPGHFGQGWPGLIYLPTVSFLPSAERSQMGLGDSAEELRNRLSMAHEIAHQWWGNQVGWKTYRDQWLSEGLASYAAALYRAQDEDGERIFRELMRRYKQDLLSKTREGHTVESGGPIWLGHRLRSSLNPDGYATIVYEKSCWVLHMLRALMTDAETGSDSRFFEMLKDFVARYRNSRASTEDFVRHAEQYMTPAMDLEGDGRLDWFFSAWVYGTGIPTYKLRAEIRQAAPQEYVVGGQIEQSNVPAEFEMMVPLVAEYGKVRKRLGWVHVEETGGRFEFTTTSKPTRVAIDEDVLLAMAR